MTRFDLSDTDAQAFCPSCGSGYTAGVSVCPECEKLLVPRAEIEARGSAAVSEDDVTEESVMLCTVADQVQAAAVRSRLKEAGIPYSEQGEDPQPALYTGLLGRVEFRVIENDLERAQEALGEELLGETAGASGEMDEGDEEGVARYFDAEEE